MKFFPFQFCIVENIRFEFPTWVNELEFQTVEPITRLFLNNTPYTLQICCTFQAHKHSSYYLLIFKRINIGRKDEGEKRSHLDLRSSICLWIDIEEERKFPNGYRAKFPPWAIDLRE